MWTLVVVAFMALRVSGDEEVTVVGYLGGSVLLPCTCLDRNVGEVFKWQMGDKVLLNKNAALNDSYKDRAKLFLSENSSNCSVLLTNITEDDQEEYKCIFRKGEQYTRFLVHLNVSVHLTPTSASSSSSPTQHHPWIIPIVLLVLAVSLVLYFVCKKRRESNIREVETGDFYRNCDDSEETM